jgi:hypothetical protein
MKERYFYNRTVTIATVTHLLADLDYQFLLLVSLAGFLSKYFPIALCFLDLRWPPSCSVIGKEKFLDSAIYNTVIFSCLRPL